MDATGLVEEMPDLLDELTDAERAILSLLPD
jgi:hypothetical protein